ncbi:hypothetical protein AB5G97_07425 [Aeromonas veronii]|uniref:hypothetical protein n=1 Tax=Aeromonas veronii TaxID=654 RepID=UPI00367260E5
MKYNPNYLRATITLPVLFLGLNIYIVILHELIVFFLNGRLNRHRLILLLSPIAFLAIIIAQLYLDYNGETLFGVLSDPSLRTYDAMGTIELNGNVDFVAIFKMFTYFSLVFLFLSNIKCLYDWCDLFIIIVRLNVILVIVIFFLCYSDLALAMLKKLALNSPNFLTVDDIGNRVSGFYYEPSQFSLMMSTVLASLYFFSRDKKTKVQIVFSLLLFFSVSRSVTLLASFLLCITLLYRPRLFVAFSLVSLLLMFNSDSIIESIYGSSSLFRSLLARTVVTNFSLSFPYNMFGGDFGQVTSFYPFYGIIFQTGYLGLFLVFIILKFRIPLAMLILLLFSVSPRLWYFDIYLPATFIYIAYYSRELAIVERKVLSLT